MVQGRGAMRGSKPAMPASAGQSKITNPKAGPRALSPRTGNHSVGSAARTGWTPAKDTPADTPAGGATVMERAGLADLSPNAVAIAKANTPAQISPARMPSRGA